MIAPSMTEKMIVVAALLAEALATEWQLWRRSCPTSLPRWDERLFMEERTDDSG